MKKIVYFASLVLLASLLIVACKKDDDSTPPVEHTITTFTPTSGPPETLVTINGTKFTNQNISVKFNGVDAEISSVAASGNLLMAFVPEGAQTGKISVTIDGVEVKSTNVFTVTEEVSGPDAIELAATTLEMHTLDTSEFPEITNLDEFPNGSSFQIESNNPDIVAINEEGDLVALQAGSAEIEVTMAELSATVDVDVNSSEIITGYVNNGTYDIPTLWINGVAHDLNDGTEDATAEEAIIKGTTIYVAGYGGNLNRIAKLWTIQGEDITELDLTDGTRDAYGRSLAADDDFVYVVGDEKRININDKVAKLWKLVNGELVAITPLTHPEGSDANASAIAISENGTRYIVGHQEINGAWKARVWENEENETQLETSNMDNESFSSDIYVDGTQVYILGRQSNDNGDYPTVWEEGQPHILPSSSQYAYASSIIVDGGTIFVGGRQLGDHMQGAIWNNDSYQDLDDSGVDSSVNSIFYYNSKVIAVGYDLNDGFKSFAVKWVNGEKSIIAGDGINDARAKSIIIK
ncbi:IPT/TIG domain-containing protein [Flagellimonas flava]|uniref:IPT/TIG domain-containing protein n=1 Tax=Flagellimonas flava TaxID=570519 RepID=A0A1M5PZD0_9FLAO|nr:IPT/TIG domain-containing protein [Allomuricauda flava]SHH07050.1 IPT/TIG domain-containing protein [Allomuricauda flava]